MQNAAVVQIIVLPVFNYTQKEAVYKEERHTITRPDGTEETTIKIEHNDSGLFEFCMACATITFCILAVCITWKDVNSRRLDSPIHQPQTHLREADKASY